MNAGNLDTTNLLLGIMAAVSVLEALVFIGVGVMAYRLYGQAMRPSATSKRGKSRRWWRALTR